MWNRPDLLNAAASALYAVAAALALYAAATIAINRPAFALREIRLVGVPLHVTAGQLSLIANRDLQGNFFTLDLAHARAALGNLPWVRSVDLRRRWPDGLDVALEEHEPLARWGDTGLVNTQGEVFEAAYDGELPVFSGPPGTAKEIAIQYEYFRRRLAAIDRLPVRVQVSPRRAWSVTLDNGMTLELGRSETEARLTRFIAAYRQAAAVLGRRVDYVDLRYPNGFAVRVPELAQQSAAGRGERKRGRSGT